MAGLALSKHEDLMEFLAANAHDAVLSDATARLAEILWHLLKAEQTMQAQCYRRIKEGPFERSETTEFGDEVGRDEIHWWIFKKEHDLEGLHARSTSALEAADRLKTAATRLQSLRPESYGGLLTALREFTKTQHAEIQTILDYLIWLRSRNALAPSILFTYRVWGSTRRGDRWLDVNGDEPASENEVTRRTLTELALGLRGGVGLCAYDRAIFDVGGELYERDPERAGEIEVPEDEVVARASWRILGEFAIFFEWIRNSLRNVLIDIEKCVAQRNLLNSDAFWRRFILATLQTKKQETQLWDFKETLSVWYAKGDARNAAKVTFAEDVASFANAEGGVLIVGVSDEREVVGIGSGRELEARLKFARDILKERLDYPREIISFRQVIVPHTNGSERVCLVVVVARSIEAVGVSDGAGQFTYPVRRETGISRESGRDINNAKAHAKSEDHDFMNQLEQFVKDR